MISEEVLTTLSQMPSDKALGPNGFTGSFFRSCWGIIKQDLMEVIQSFWELRTSSLHWINTSNIVLIPKKEGADKVSHYRPISLIHGIAKINSKVLALRLTPYMHSLVS